MDGKGKLYNRLSKKQYNALHDFAVKKEANNLFGQESGNHEN